MSEIGRHASMPQMRGEEPRSISGLSIVALVLGLAAALALTAPYMWLLPMAGVAVSIAALFSIARDPQGKIGKPAAMAGLLLSLLFGSWAISNHVTRERLLYRQAQQYGERWLQMVLEGDLHAAHQLKMTQDERQSPGTDLVTYYQEHTEANRSFRDFARQSPVAQLAQMGPEATVRWVDDVRSDHEHAFGGPFDRITQSFEVESAGQDGQNVQVQLTLVRSIDRWFGEARWRLEEVRAVGE
jgi:hypothetical protein